MTALLILLGVLLWIIVGLIVCEQCRIWKAWWINPLDPILVVAWPVVLIFVIDL